MNFSRIFPILLVSLALGFALSSCGKNGSTNGAVGSHRSDIPLADVSASEGCLSLPKLFDALRNVDPSRSGVLIPTNISFDAPVAIREDFRRVIAYGQLVVLHRPVRELVSLPAVTQDGCTSVTATGSDGVDKSFKVKTSAKDSLMAEADDGERIEYAWLSPTSVQSRHRYAVLDQPCTNSSKPVLVTVTKVIAWSSADVPAAVPANGSPFSIDSQFVTLAGEAVGESPDSVYATAADGTKTIELAKVNEMTAKPPRTETLSCGGINPTPDPTPSPTPGPTPSPTPGPNPDPSDPHSPDFPWGG